MITIELNGKRYLVKYSHTKQNVLLPNGGMYTHVTEAYINDGSKATGDFKIIAKGVAMCSKHDQFSKKIGRTIATSRLLHSLHGK